MGLDGVVLTSGVAIVSSPAVPVMSCFNGRELTASDEWADRLASEFSPYLLNRTAAHAHAARSARACA